MRKQAAQDARDRLERIERQAAADKRAAEQAAQAERERKQPPAQPPAQTPAMPTGIGRALDAWGRASTAAQRSQSAQQWMRAVEQVKKTGGSVTAASAATQQCLGDGYMLLMRQVGIEAQRQRQRGLER